MLEELRTAHRELRRSFTWQPDEVTWKRPEHWSRPRQQGARYFGDCDDWSMEIDHRMSQLGLSLLNRRLAVCRINRRSKASIDHCVFVLDEGGTYHVSCCNQREVALLGDLPYDNWQLSPVGLPITQPWVPLSG